MEIFKSPHLQNSCDRIIHVLRTRNLIAVVVQANVECIAPEFYSASHEVIIVFIQIRTSVVFLNSLLLFSPSFFFFLCAKRTQSMDEDVRSAW